MRPARLVAVYIDKRSVYFFVYFVVYVVKFAVCEFEPLRDLENMSVNWNAAGLVEREQGDAVSYFVADSHQTIINIDTCNYEFGTVTEAQLSELCLSCLTELIYGWELINRLLRNFIFSFLFFFIRVLRSNFSNCAYKRAILS